MVTLEQLVTRAYDDDDLPVGLSRADVELIVRSTIAGLGFHVSESTGEVCDPRQPPVINYPYDQNGARWPGSGRFRRRGGQ